MLTLQFVPYSDIEALSSLGKIRKLLNIAKEDKIVLLEGRLKKEEEAELIKTTMEEIDDGFKGIELAVMDSRAKTGVKSTVLSLLLGNRQGFTIIGPASIVKEIKKDPNKIQLFTKDGSRNKLKKKNNKARKRR